MDNAKKLIPESYKVDGNEFEMTDGNETYRVKWSSLINEGIVLTSSNKSQINEDMQKMKHLMGFKSQDTLGTVKGAARLDENKKFANILNKTKRLLNEVKDESEYSDGISDDERDIKHQVNYGDQTNVNNPILNGNEHYADYMDIAQFHPNTPLSMSTGEYENSYELEKLGKEIVDTEYGGDIGKAYDTIVTNDNVRRWQKAYRKLLATQRGEKRGLDEKELTPAQKKEIDLNRDGKITKNDFEIMHQLKDLDKEAEKKNKSNEAHIKEEEEVGALSKGDIGKELKTMGSTISQADFENAKERGVVTRLLDIVKKLAKESNGYSPGVKMKLDYLEKEINDAIASGGAAEGDESYPEKQKGFNNEEATFTSKYDKHPKLKGDQHTLPDEIQADIVGVDEANKISHRSIRNGGMGGRLKSNYYNRDEVKGKPQGHALRQADKEEIAYQLANMKPDNEALRHAAYDDDDLEDYSLTYEERANGNTEDLYEKKDRFEEVFEGIYEEESNEGLQVDDIYHFKVTYENVKNGDYHEEYLGTKGGDDIYELTLTLIDDNVCLGLVDGKQIFLEGEITCAYSQSFEYEDNSFDHEFGTHDPGSSHVINEIKYFKIRKLDIKVIGEEDEQGNAPILKTIKTGEISKEEFNNIFSGIGLYDTLGDAVNDIIHEAANNGDILPPDNF